MRGRSCRGPERYTLTGVVRCLKVASMTRTTPTPARCRGALPGTGSLPGDDDSAPSVAGQTRPVGQFRGRSHAVAGGRAAAGVRRGPRLSAWAAPGRHPPLSAGSGSHLDPRTGLRTDGRRTGAPEASCTGSTGSRGIRDRSTAGDRPRAAVPAVCARPAAGPGECYPLRMFWRPFDAHGPGRPDLFTCAGGGRGRSARRSPRRRSRRLSGPTASCPNPAYRTRSKWPMPGLGVRSGARILIDVRDGTGLPTAAHLASCAGLAPATRSSGSSIRGERPSRRGNEQRKRAFFLSPSPSPPTRHRGPTTTRESPGANTTPRPCSPRPQSGRRALCDAPRRDLLRTAAGVRGQLTGGSAKRTTRSASTSNPSTGCPQSPSGSIGTGLPSRRPIARWKPQNTSSR